MKCGGSTIREDATPGQRYQPQRPNYMQIFGNELESWGKGHSAPQSCPPLVRNHTCPAPYSRSSGQRGAATGQPILSGSGHNRSKRHSQSRRSSESSREEPPCCRAPLETGGAEGTSVSQRCGVLAPLSQIPVKGDLQLIISWPIIHCRHNPVIQDKPTTPGG